MTRTSKRIQANPQGLIHEEHVDDNMLPAPSDLAKYQAIDGVLPYILDAAKEEREHRYMLNDRTMKIHESDAAVRVMDAKTRATDSKRLHHSNLFRLLLSTIVLLSVIAVSAYFLYLGKNLGGGLFGLPAVYILFRSFDRRSNATQQKKGSQ